VDDKTNSLDTVLDAEIVEEPKVQNAQDGEAIVLLNLEGMIKSNISSIDKLTEEVRIQKEMLDSIFENDETFKAHSAAAKEAQRIKTATKNEILKRPDVAHVFEKFKGIKLELKEAKESLASYLSEYQRMSGVNEIAGEDGIIREIIYVPKLIKRGQKNS